MNIFYIIFDKLSIYLKFWQEIIIIHKAKGDVMKANFNVFGMTCSACSAHVEKAVSKLNGVKTVQVNLLTNSMLVEFDENILNISGIIRTVEEAGYRAESADNRQKDSKTAAKSEEKNHKGKLNGIITSLIFLILLMYVSMGHMINLPLPEFLKSPFPFAFTQFLLTLPVVIINGNYFKNGFLRLIKGAPNMDTLVALGSSAGIVYGIFAVYMISYGYYIDDMNIVHSYAHELYFESSAMILTLISIGKYLEEGSKKKTAAAIEKLIKLAPDTARVIKDGKETDIKVSELAVGDKVIIKSGESIPADGKITEGNCTVDESAITGESMPKEKSVGDKVTAATICKSGYVIAKCERVGSDTTLSKIISLVEEASSGKAPISRLADKISGIFVPIVILISVITAIAWLILGKGVEFALSCAVCVLVISCPCALGLATPTAVMAGTGRGASYGILIKSAEALELLNKADIAVMDKTGTVTKGKPEITDFIPCGSFSEEEAKKYLVSCERMSSHPLAQAVVSSFGKNFVNADNYREIDGMGIECIIEGKKVFAGNAKMMKEYNIDFEEYKNITDKLYNSGKTVIFLAADNKPAAIAGLSDTLKENSKKAVSALKKMNIKTVLLTGDNKKSADFVKKEAGFDSVISEVLPADKDSCIKNLQADGKKVVMIGDGINDAPALTRADVGIAIGVGTEIAIDSADVVLMKSDPYDAVNAIKLSRATVKNIKENLFWAFFYNVIGIPLAAGVYYPHFNIKLSPMFGAFAMSLSSLFVVTNALRLTRFKPEKIKIKNTKEMSVMKKTMKIEGMSCSHCSSRVEKALNELNGVNAEVNLEEKEAVITLTENVSDDVLIKAVTDAGYEVKSIS